MHYICMYDVHYIMPLLGMLQSLLNAWTLDLLITNCFVELYFILLTKFFFFRQDQLINGGEVVDDEKMYTK